MAFVSHALSDMPALEAACQLLSRTEDRISVVLMDREVDETHRAFEVFGIKDVMIQPFDAIDVNRTLHGALGLWRPYLVNALAAERDIKREEAAQVSPRGLKHPSCRDRGSDVMLQEIYQLVQQIEQAKKADAKGGRGCRRPRGQVRSGRAPARALRSQGPAAPR